MPAQGIFALNECGRASSWIPEDWFDIDQSHSDAEVKPAIPNVCNSMIEGMQNVQSAMLDTGCTPQSVFTTGLELCLVDARPADANYRGAFGTKRLVPFDSRSLTPLSITLSAASYVMFENVK